MEEQILSLPSQLLFRPEISNPVSRHFNRFIVVGMGGSHLAAGLIKSWRPEIDIVVHNDYGLPALPEEVLKDSLIIASSYSGNTEEVLDTASAAQAAGLSLAVITVGGKLLDLATTNHLPYIQLPETGIQPRSALGYSTIAMLKLIGLNDGVAELSALGESLKPAELEAAGKELADSLRGKVPIIYASKRNASLTYIWKIKFNETGKIPAFANVIPELNHNEMNGFDSPRTGLQNNYACLFLVDPADYPPNKKRMSVLQGLYEKRALPVHLVELSGHGWEKIFRNLLLADWVAYYTAVNYGHEAAQVPMVETFKKLIADR